MKYSDVQLPSNRKFGSFFTFVFLAAASYFMWKGAIELSAVMGGLASIFALVTIIRAQLLLPLNKLWMGLGFLLGAITSPIVLGVIFFFLFTPIALLMRLFRRDELRLRKRKAKSYWKLREEIQINSDFFKYQF